MENVTVWDFLSGILFATTIRKRDMPDRQTDQLFSALRYHQNKSCMNVTYKMINLSGYGFASLVEPCGVNKLPLRQLFSR